MILSCRGVTLSYDGMVAVKNVSFELEERGFLCIVGRNGSGKSTLMRGMLGLHRPSSGEFVLDGGRGGIGYMPQQTAVRRDFPAGVYEVVLSGRLNKRGLSPFYTRDDRQSADRNMELLGIRDIKNKFFRDLSGGQRQRALLARALCAADRLLLLDEPANGLDPGMTAGLYSILGELNRERGLTVAMISHDLKSAVRYADKILHLDTETLFYGDTGEYMESGAFRKLNSDME